MQTTYAASDKYVVNLLSQKQEIDLNKVKNIDNLNRLYDVIVYSKLTGSGKNHVLSVGYFSSYQEANKASIQLGNTYEGAYAVEFISSYTLIKSVNRLPQSSSTLPVNQQSASMSGLIPELAVTAQSGKSNSTLSDDQLEKIMSSAKSALKQSDNRKAIQLFSAILSVTENKYSREALELLGLARERNDQLNHAANIYAKYIEKYPDSEGVSRVKQRFAALTTAGNRIDKKDEKVDRSRARPWDTMGSLSQSYSNNNGDDVDLYTFLSLTGRKRNEDTDLKLQFTGSRTTPIKGLTDSDFQISEMFVDVFLDKASFSTKVGRQRSRSGGLYGRLDGLLLSYDSSGSTRYNFLAGITVDSSRANLFDTKENKKFAYGINVDMSFLDKSLDLNLYALEQLNDSVLDRQVIGVEVKYFKKSISVFSLLDYDTSYSEMNIFLLTGNLKLTDNYDLFFNLDLRNNPLLSTTNALIGQAESDLGTLVSVLGEEAVRQLALDRSSTSKLLSLGLLTPLNNNTTIRGDITATQISSSEASGGVLATPEFGPDYYYSLQFVTKDYFGISDTTTLQFRYSDTEISQSVSALVTTRIPLTRTLRITPRVIVSSADFESGQKRTDIGASIRTDYKYGKSLQMDVDVGMNSSKMDNSVTSSVNNYYLIASYHWMF